MFLELLWIYVGVMDLFRFIQKTSLNLATNPSWYLQTLNIFSAASVHYE